MIAAGAPARLRASSDALCPLPPSHQKALHRAFVQLEEQNFAARLADYAGQPVEKVLRYMPKAANRQFNRIVETAMLRCLNLAIRSLDPSAKGPPATGLSSLMAGINGGVSGFFGVAALPIELPLTTTLMLRSIADTARHYGEDLSQLEARLACVEVFALGSSNAQKRLDIGYFATRTVLARLAGAASTQLIERSTVSASTPVVSGFISEIVSRFGVVLSERFAASALPVLGAIGGATINVIFMNHFQRVAQGHFIIRRLERLYGAATVRRQYDELFEPRGREQTPLRAASY
jgi:EcsC protein family